MQNRSGLIVIHSCLFQIVFMVSFLADLAPYHPLRWLVGWPAHHAHLVIVS
jgi:hypothetical protein